MAVDVGMVAAATVTTIAPFTPFLIEIGKASAKKLTEVVAEKGGEAAWQKAQALWQKAKANLGKDTIFQSAATMVADNPDDEARQKMLAQVLAERLNKEEAFAEELWGLLGGRDSIQQVLADGGSWVEDIVQESSGSGQQTVRASNNSVIKGVRQIKA